MKYITTRIALEAFEYDPYGFKPEWFLKMVKEGRAFIYKETKESPAYAEIEGYKAYVGYKIYIDETGYIGAWSPEQFARRHKVIDMSRDAAGAFIDRLNDAIFNNERK